MNMLYNRRILIGLLAAFGLGLALIWLMLIREEQSIAINTSTRLDSERLALEKMERDLANVAAIRQRFQDNQAEMTYFRETFLSAKDERVVRISEFLENRAKAHELQLDQVGYSLERSRNRDLDIYRIDLPLIGRYRDIRTFIDEIERSDIFLTITELTLEEEGGMQGAVRMQLSLATYFEGGAE